VIISKAGSVLVQALSNDWTLVITAAGGASASGTAVSGNIQTTVAQNKTNALIGDYTKVTAYDSVGIVADHTSHIYLAAPTVAVSGGGAGVGATIVTAVLRNEINAGAGNNTDITAYAMRMGSEAGILTSNRQQRRKGIVISALGAEDILMLGIGASGASSAAVSGVVDTLVVMNKVNAKVGNNARMRSGTRPSDDKDGDGNADGKSSSGDIDVEAEDDSVIYNFGGAVAVSADLLESVPPSLPWSLTKK
jgi:hypothetical protein